MSLARNVLPVCAGILAGALAPLLYGRTAAPTPSASAAPAPPAAASGARTVVVRGGGGEDAETRDLAARVGRLEQAAVGEPAGAPDLEADPEEVREQLAADRDAWLAAHEREPVDPAWAGAAEASLGRGLEAVAAGAGLRVVGVRCKTTTCVGTVEWPTYDAATAAYGTVLHQRYEPNCTRSILLPEPPDPGAPYRAELTVDCGEGG